MTRRAPSMVQVYTELRERHPQLPDPCWVSADGLNIELDGSGYVAEVELTVILVGDHTPLNQIDMTALGVRIDDPEMDTPVYYEAMSWWYRQLRPDTDLSQVARA